MSTTRTMSDGTEIDVEAVDDTFRRALTEPMLVYEDHPDAQHDHEAVVYSESREYRINVDLDYCPCPAYQYHHDDGEDCKHLLRYKLAVGAIEIPDWVQLDAVDISLRKRLNDVEVADA